MLKKVWNVKQKPDHGPIFQILSLGGWRTWRRRRGNPPNRTPHPTEESITQGKVAAGGGAINGQAESRLFVCVCDDW